MSAEVVVVLGGTGTIGQHLVPRLCELLSVIPSDACHVVRVVTRDVEKASETFAHLRLYSQDGVVQLQIVKGSVEDLPSMEEALSGATRLFLLTLTSLRHQQVAVEGRILSLLGVESGQNTAAGSNIRHVVRLSAHSRGMEGQPSNSPFRWHSECDEQLLRLCSQSFQTSRHVDVTILRPSLFMQDMTRRHFAPLIREKDIFYQLGSAPKSRDSKCYEDSYGIAMVDARDIADVAACALSEPIEKHAHNTYILSGPNALLWGDVADAISSVCGRHIKAVMLSDKEFYDQFGGSHIYLKQMQAYRSGCGEDVDGDIEVVTGHASRSITQFCEEHSSSWLK